MAAPQMSFADFLLQSKGLAPVFKPPTAPGTLNLQQPMPTGQPPGLDLSQANKPQGLMEQLQRNPSLSLALMQAGLSMMQPHSKQQTHVGHIAQSALGGVNTYVQNEDRLQKKELAEKESARQDKMVGIAERGDARQQTRAEQETEEFDYQKGRRSFRETIEELQRDGASLGLDAKKLQLELTQQFGKKEAQAKLDQLLAQTDYYKNGGKEGAARVTAKVQEISDRVFTIQANNPNMTEAEARKQAWEQEDIARSAQATAAGQNAATAQSNARVAELKVWQDVAGDILRTPEEREFAKKQAERLSAAPDAAAPPPATSGGGHVFPDGTPVNYNTVRALYIRQKPNATEAEIDREVNAYLQSLSQ